MRLKGPKHDRQRRELPLPPIAVDALKARRRAAFAEGHGSTYVFPSSSGTPLRKSNFVRRSWHPLREQLFAPAGDEPTAEQLERARTMAAAFHFHDLRHSLGALMRRLGIDAQTRQEQCGHESIATTIGVYGHAAPQTLRDAAAALDAFIQEQIQGPDATVPATVTPRRRTSKQQKTPL